jgi:ribosomal-protein-alanine N-acetyltransferase
VIRLFPSSLLGPPPVVLEAPKCRLRPPVPRDWREWAELRSSSRAFLTPWEPSWPVDALSRSAYGRRLRRQTEDWRQDMGYSFFIYCRETDALVGGIGISNVRRGVAQTAMLGYWVGARYARQGYVAAATRRLLDFSFRELGLHRIEAACLPTNVASRGLLEKVGFVNEGYARGYLRIDGTWCDHVLYAILNEDWLGLLST